MAEQSEFRHHQQRALEWARSAQAGGWLAAEDVAAIEAWDLRSPELLFADEAGRPLVVALFGGTGVGKSTLLNRLARQEVATTGVLRPTSREISVFMHESVKLGPSSESLPMDKVRVSHHANEFFRHVLWVDMPDFDSTDRANHDLALQWLPHIDMVIYVVSPERYRDDRGWRLLLEHEHEHAWMFVFNQWDRAHPAQLEDFERLLQQGGFVTPVVLRTECRNLGEPVAADDFVQLEKVVAELATDKMMAQLTMHNRQARRQILSRAFSALVEKVGADAAYGRLEGIWAGLWADTSVKLRRGLHWAVGELAARFVQREGNFLQRSLDLRRAVPEPPAELPALSLIWDEWAQLCFDDALDHLLVECRSLALPSGPLDDKLGSLRNSASRRVLDRAQTALRDALSHRGNIAQRLWLKLSGAITVIAPLLAIGWVAYEVVIEYYQSVQDDVPFLGTNFAIHSALLIAVSWLLPYFLHRKLRPSTERTARAGLQKGLDGALAELDAATVGVLSEYRKGAAANREEGLRLLASIAPILADGKGRDSSAAEVRQFLAKTGGQAPPARRDLSG